METVVIFIFLTTFLLAYANGANDNFKGVATLYGSKTLDYKKPWHGQLSPQLLGVG